jgi:thiol-disulfide isomerase/thioredoxin
MNIIKYFIITFIFCVAHLNNFGSEITLKYIIRKDSNVKLISDHLFGLNNNANDPIDLYYKRKISGNKILLSNSPTEEIISVTYKLNREGIYFIEDLIGHEILLDNSMSKDTVVLILNKIHPKAKQLNLNDSIASPWFYAITFPDKFKYMGFFDSLTYHCGDLRYDYRYTFKVMNHDVPNYLYVTKRIYQERIKFLKQFCSAYYMPLTLKNIVYKEVQYAYYQDLLKPCDFDSKILHNYPPDIKALIKKLETHLSDIDGFRNTTTFRATELAYVFSDLKDFTLKDKSIPDSIYILDRLNYCLKSLKGEIQSYALARLLQIASLRNNLGDKFIKVYDIYNHKIAPQGVNEYVDSLYKIVVHSGGLSNEEVLALKFEDNTNQTRMFKNLFEKDLILIDCWATWCIPCLKEMPYLDSIANDFKEKVQFIALSADQFPPKWHNWLSTNPPKNKNIIQLHSPGGSDNIFFRRLLISSIPRYILVSRSGKILEVNMPYPSKKEDFVNKINFYLTTKIN